MQRSQIWIILTFLVALYLGQVEQEAFAYSPSNGESTQEGESHETVIKLDDLYHQAWQLIRDTFYDPTLNGQRWSYWEHRFKGKLKTLDDAHKGIETMLVSLADRYTRFLNAQAFADENMQIAARLYGVGIQIGMNKNGKVVVISALEGTPAERAGLMPLDEISEIDGKSVDGLSVEDVSGRIRGPIGTEVAIAVVRNKERMEFKLTRAEIAIRSVQSARMLNSDVGYIRLSTFMSKDASDEMRDALTKLSPARGIVLDLRDNPGGLLNNAIDVSNIFLDGGVIVSTVDRKGKKTHAMSIGKPISRQPLVVLINPRSASASEITSGALRDNGRAELVGEKSLGKALVQAIHRLPDGSGINITIARYVTPDGIDINKVGIVPDYVVALTGEDYREARGPWWLDPGGPIVKRSPEDMKDIQLSKAVEVLEKKMKSTEAQYELKLRFPGFGPSYGF